MLRWVEIEPDDIGGFAFKVGIVARHVAFQPMRLQSGFPPHAMHHVLAHLNRRSQFAAAPVRGTIFWFSACRCQNLGSQRRRQHDRLLPRMIRIESLYACFQESLFPTRDGGPRRLQAFLNHGISEALGQHQNQFSPENEAGRQGPRLSDLVQIRSLLFRQGKWFGCERHIL